MGQQQLLLIVLGVIIVGIAIVAGIGMFNAGAEEAVKDELVAQCMAIGANAQQWYKKPVAMGGGGNSFTGYEIPGRMEATENAGVIGTDGYATTAGYVLTEGDQSITITADPNDALQYNWEVSCVVTPLNITTTVATP